jgi:hypothetical protein
VSVGCDLADFFPIFSPGEDFDLGCSHFMSPVPLLLMNALAFGGVVDIAAFVGDTDSVATGMGAMGETATFALDLALLLEPFVAGVELVDLSLTFLTGVDLVGVEALFAIGEDNVASVDLEGDFAGVESARQNESIE